MLIDNADRGFPVHMNLALTDRNKVTKSNGGESNDDEANRILRRLKSQNHQLTEVKSLYNSFKFFPKNQQFFNIIIFNLQEVGRKSERITLLEKEKSSLIRELFQARSQPQNRALGVPHLSDDNTLM